MKHEPRIVEQCEPEASAIAAAIARARADFAADRGVDHLVVSEWLKTWGTPDRQPFAEWLSGWNA